MWGKHRNDRSVRLKLGPTDHIRGWRPLSVTPGRTKGEFAHYMAELVDVHVPEVEKIGVVLDNLSTPTLAALYEVIPPDEARCMLCKLELYLTPVPGS
jgi:hypothetical protein